MTGRWRRSRGVYPLIEEGDSQDIRERLDELNRVPCRWDGRSGNHAFSPSFPSQASSWVPIIHPAVCCRATSGVLFAWSAVTERGRPASSRHDRSVGRCMPAWRRAPVSRPAAERMRASGARPDLAWRMPPGRESMRHGLILSHHPGGPESSARYVSPRRSPAP